ALEGAATVVSQTGMAVTGQISDDAVLKLWVNGTPVSVVVPRGATLNNHSVDDFVVDLNTSLARALRDADLDPTSVVASRKSPTTEIALTGARGVVLSLVVSADAGSVANTQLGFGVTTGQHPILDTGAFLPVNGQLQQDLTFAVFVDGHGVGSVTVNAASTATNAALTAV